MANEIEIVAVFDHDSKNYHCFSIREVEGVKGSVYISKDVVVPDAVNVRLMTKGEAEAEKNR